MGNVIQVDFRRERNREMDAYKAFEEAMKKHEKARRFKTAGLMASVSLLIILWMSSPFFIEKVSGLLNSAP